MKEVISIEEAINLSSGSRAYQKRILFILVLGEVSLCSFIMTNAYLLPSITEVCDESSPSCTMDQRLKNSASYELNAMGGNEYLINYFRTSYFVGMLLGSLIIPWISDKYGRLPTIKYTSFLGILCYAAGAFVPSMLVLSLLAFAIGILEVGFFMMSFVLLTEMLGHNNRNLYLGIFKTLVPLSAIWTIGLYMINLQWNYILLVSGSYLLLKLFLLRYVFESPRFLITNLVDIQGATKVIEEIAKINGVKEFSYELKSENISEERLTIGDICSDKSTVIKLWVCANIWFCLVTAGYSLIFIMPEFISDIYLQGIVMFCADMIAVIPVMYFINTIGRKNTTIGNFIITGVCFFGILILSYTTDDRGILEAGTIIFTIIARLALSGETYLIYIYTAELFPTYFRSTAFGICNFMARFGGILASNLLLICGYVGINYLIVLGVMALLTAVQSLMLEETRMKPLKEMIDKNELQPLLENSRLIG